MAIYSSYIQNPQPAANSLEALTASSDRIRNMARTGLAAQVESLMKGAATDADQQLQQQFSDNKDAYRAQWDAYTQKWGNWQGQMVPYLNSQNKLNGDWQTLHDQAAVWNEPNPNLNGSFDPNPNDMYFNYLPGSTFQTQQDLANRTARPGSQLNGSTFQAPTAPLAWGNLTAGNVDITKTPEMEMLANLERNQMRSTVLGGYNPQSSKSMMNFMQNIRGDKMLDQSTNAAKNAYNQDAGVQTADLNQQQAAYGGLYQQYLTNKGDWEHTLDQRELFDNNIIAPGLGKWDQIHNGNSVQLQPNYDSSGHYIGNYWAGPNQTSIGASDVNQTNQDIGNAKAYESQLVNNSTMDPQYKQVNGNSITITRPDIYSNPKFVGGDFGKQNTPSYLPSITPYNPTLKAIGDVTNTYAGNDYLTKLMNMQNINARFGLIYGNQ